MGARLFAPPNEFLNVCEQARCASPTVEAAFFEVYLSNWVEYGRAGELDDIEPLIALALRRLEASHLVDVVTRSGDSVSAYSARKHSTASDVALAIEYLLPRPASNSGIVPAYKVGAAIVDGKSRDALLIALTDAQDQASGQSRLGA